MAQIRFKADALRFHDAGRAERIEKAIEEAAAKLEPANLSLDCQIREDRDLRNRSCMSIQFGYPGWAMTLGMPLDASVEDIGRSVQLGLLGSPGRPIPSRRGLPF